MDERCREQLASCNKRFEKGAESFAEMKAEIRHLQEKDIMINGTSKENKTEIAGRMTYLENRVNQIELSFAKASNRILAGISITCILLVIDIATRIGG